MDKVRQVGESYELNKYKALNKTIELDASLANERLFATKLRLNQVSSMNDKLGKQLRLVQQQYRSQEQKLLLTETMLRQFIESREIGVGGGGGIGVGVNTSSSNNYKQLQAIAAASAHKQQQPANFSTSSGKLARLRAKKSSTSAAAAMRRAPLDGGQQASNKPASEKNPPASNTTEQQANLKPLNSNSATTKTPEILTPNQAATSAQTNGKPMGATDKTKQQQQQEQQVASSNSGRIQQQATRQVSSSATQTQTSRTKMIINDLRQRLNLVGSKSEY